jgi:peptidoglycan hydrolase-like protein with peptidoglycan-binding domain
MDKSLDKQSRSMEKNGKDKQQVRMVQEALKDKGYDPGAIDGAMGPRTSAALRDFQQAEGLRATGRLDAETRTKLGI